MLQTILKIKVMAWMVVLGLVSTLSAQPRPLCGSAPQLWSEILTAQLPLFANIELARVKASYRVILVSPPEVVVLSPEELAALGVTDPNEAVFQLYFSTLERRLVKGSDPDIPASDSFEGRRTDTLNLAYRAYITRSRTPAQSPWTLFSLQVKGPGVPPRDISEGAIAQAIRAWQRGGCPAPTDFDITQPPAF